MCTGHEALLDFCPQVFVWIVWVSAFWSYRETDNSSVVESCIDCIWGMDQCTCSGESEEYLILVYGPVILAISACCYIVEISIYRFSSPEGVQYYFRSRKSDDGSTDSTHYITQMVWLLGAYLLAGIWTYFDIIDCCVCVVLLVLRRVS